MQRSTERIGFFELRTVIEKTSRAFDMPNVVFSSTLLPFVDFHVQTLRPILIKKNRRKEGSLQEKTLLVDTRSGEPLISQQVARTFRGFLSRIDRELKKITPMALRGSYATMMLQAYRSRTVFKGKSKAKFLEFLAKSMNTSVEQLAVSYAGNDMSDFEYCALELTSFLAQQDTEEPRERRDESESVLAVKSLWR